MKNKVIAFGTILLACSGVFLMSERSLPGDAVYAVKTSFIERSVGLLHFSIKNHTRYEWQTLEKRLHEAMLLYRSGNERAESSDTIAALIERSAEQVVQGLQEQRGTDDAEVADVAVRGMATLGAYAAMLRKNNAESAMSTMKVIQRTMTNLRKASEQSIHAIVIGQKGNDTKFIARSAFQSASALVESIPLPKNGVMDVKYVAAQEALQGADVALKDGKFGSAFELSNRAKGLATELHVVLREM